MTTNRSLPRYFLTIGLVLFLICGFTVTPIAAAEISYMTEAHTTPAPPELVERYSAIDAAAASQSSVAYKDLAAASSTADTLLGGLPITAADIDTYLQKHPENASAAGPSGGLPITAADIYTYLQKHPEIARNGILADPELKPLVIDNISPAGPQGYYVCITAADIINYLHAHPEYQGGTFDGQAFTPADVINYLRAHPDYKNVFYFDPKDMINYLRAHPEVQGGTFDGQAFTPAENDDYLRCGPDYEDFFYFDPKDVWQVMWISTVATLVISIVGGLALGLIPADALLADALMVIFMDAMLACWAIAMLALIAVVVVVNIVYAIIKICANGWEQLLILPVLFTIWSRKRKMQRISPSAHDSCAYVCSAGPLVYEGR